MLMFSTILSIMFRVLLSGPAGCGKNTIAKMLLKKFDQFGYFCAGDVIRDHIDRGTEFGKRVESFVHKGELIPDSIINGVLLEEIRHAGNKLILNGTLSAWVPKKVLIDRLSKRLVHHGSGRTYNLDFNPPKVEGKDDITGEPLFRREDDSTEVVSRRLEVHEKTEGKVVDYYR
ncbi:adenylate kinase [Trichostrongylus colubriformis]|uniref:Adenylate kinase n=1 Tax=Trichostrongylus colubriformis TaxID=6319 RepID=A0AAN8FFC0_TRICO